MKVTATPMRMSARKPEASCFAYAVEMGEPRGDVTGQACVISSGWAFLPKELGEAQPIADVRLAARREPGATGGNWERPARTAASSLVALVGAASTGIACSTTFLVALSAGAFAFSFLVFSLASTCSAAAVFAFMAAISWHTEPLKRGVEIEVLLPVAGSTWGYYV